MIQEYLNKFKDLRYNHFDELPVKPDGTPEYIITGSKDYNKYKCRNNYLMALTGRMDLFLLDIDYSSFERLTIREYQSGIYDMTHRFKTKEDIDYMNKASEYMISILEVKLAQSTPKVTDAEINDLLSGLK